jgi:hypothetical protein
MMLQRLDVWLAILTLGALAYWELHLDRLIVPIVRGVLDMAGPAVSEVKRRARAPAVMRLRPRTLRDDRGRFDGSLPAGAPKPERNEDEDRFGAVSGVAMPKDDAEMIAFHFLARLVHAGHVTETQALESACGVKAGSSKAYQEARVKLKKALDESRP